MGIFSWCTDLDDYLRWMKIGGVPLFIESLDWKHGVFLASQLKSETTAAAKHTGKQIMHDPFAMKRGKCFVMEYAFFISDVPSRPFLGYNFRHNIQHWLDFEKNRKNKVKESAWSIDEERVQSYIWFSYRKSFMLIDFAWTKTRSFSGQDSV